MNPEGDELEIQRGEVAKLVTAATQMAGQVRQIKILVLIYVIASVISIGWSAYFASTLSPPDEYDHESALPELGAADDEPESAGPSQDDPLPPINLPDADGRLWSNRDLDGKAVLLNFWATWCAPCRHEMPIFDEMQKKYASRGFTVLAVSLDREGWDVVRPYIAEREWSYPIFVADESIEREFGKITSLPTTYFVRRDGTIDTKHVGGLSESHIVRHIESLLDGEPGKGANAADSSASVKGGKSGHDTGLPERADEIGTRDIDEFSHPKMVDIHRFTRELRDIGINGSVEVELWVEADGSAHDINVVPELGNGLDERVVEALKESSFEPAKKAGEPVGMRMRMKFSFDVKKVVRPHDPGE